ncbi:MAG: SHOCT domain-containing protein [Thermodesulfobacteriota bacterium]
MLGWESFGYAFWWIFPIIMIVLCLFMMRGSMGCMGGRHRSSSSDPSLEILNKRYALGEIDKKEYDEKKSVISQNNE